MDGKEWREKHNIGEQNSSVSIYSQEELDEVPEDYRGRIWIEFGTEEKRAVLDRELLARICLCGDSIIEIRKQNDVQIWGENIVYAWNKDEGLIKVLSMFGIKTR